MESSKRERILKMLDGERTGEVFCSCNVTAVTLDIMDALNVYWPEAHMDPDLMAKLGEAQYTLLGFDSVRSGFDLGLEAQALGAEVNMGSRDRNIYITKPAFDDLDSFAIPPNLFDLGRFIIHFKALSILSDKHRNNVPIYAHIVGPLTLLGQLFGVEKVMKVCLKKPGLFQNVLERVSDIVANYGNLLINNGADLLSMAEPTASGTMISPRIFEKFMVPIYRKLSKGLKGRVVLHICGDTIPILNDIPDTGFCAFSFEGPTVEVKKVKEIIGNRMALYGNIPTVDVLMNGTVYDVRKAVMRAIEGGINSVAPACSFPLQTPINNQRAMVETVREYNRSEGFD